MWVGGQFKGSELSRFLNFRFWFSENEIVFVHPCTWGLVLQVYSWEPIICHDSVDMGWSVLGDLCIHDGNLMGCSYYRNSVAVWAADISVLPLLVIFSFSLNFLFFLFLRAHLQIFFPYLSCFSPAKLERYVVAIIPQCLT